MAETRVTPSHQTQVPAAVRRRHRVEAGDILVWEDTPTGELRIRIRKQGRLDDLVGLAPGASRGDAVAAKRRAQRGGR